MHKTKNPLSESIRETVIVLLQDRLYDAIDLAAQAKQAHWNVKGPNFMPLHELFDQIHTEMNDHADLLAERLVGLGGQAYGTIQVVSRHTSLTEYPLDASAQNDHIEHISSGLAEFGKQLYNAIDSAADHGDQSSSDIFTEIARAIDKSLLFVEAHLEG